ncbi:MAG: hypothetical protein COA94_07175 [Rickettsiales bacterium]|nr:MAG: hypothetical protein COA94_07175 [Rickettsiales bacterium]
MENSLEGLEKLRDGIIYDNVTNYIYSSPHTVPKIIHQTWKTNDIPNVWKSSRESWIKYHKKYVYVLWTDEMNRKLILDYYPWFIEYYDKFPYNIQRADAIRPFILHRYGGLYSDLDIKPTKSFEPLLKHKSSVILLSDNGRYTNMIMASNIGNPFWINVFDAMKSPNIPWYCGTRHFYIQATTGPILIDKVARNFKGKGNIIDFPSKFVQPCSICESKPCTSKKAYVIMLEGSSWHYLDSKVITFLSCKYKSLLFIFVSIIALIFIYNN